MHNKHLKELGGIHLNSLKASALLLVATEMYGHKNTKSFALWTFAGLQFVYFSVTFDVDIH